MITRGHVETIEIPVEQLSYVPGGPVDHLRTARRWCATARHGAQAVAAERAETTASPSSGPPATVVRGVSAFWRLVDVPGHRLEPVVRTWWRRSSHDDGHLRLDRLRLDGGMVELEGSFRSTSRWRRIPIEIRLWPYGGDWSLLELTPQRPTRPNRRYFRAGHDSLDRFIASLRALV